MHCAKCIGNVYLIFLTKNLYSTKNVSNLIPAVDKVQGMTEAFLIV